MTFLLSCRMFGFLLIHDMKSRSKLRRGEDHRRNAQDKVSIICHEEDI